MKNNIIILAILCAFLLSSPAQAGELSNDSKQVDAIQTAMNATVKVIVNSTENSLKADLVAQHGTGFFVGENTIITNAHVVVAAGITSIQIQLYADRETTKMCKARVGYREEAIDLAIITTDCTGTPLTLSDYVTTGQDAYVTGNPLSLEWIATKGIVARDIDYTGVKRLVLDVGLSHGNSGSPVVDSKGHVIGVAEGINKEAPYLGFAVHLKDIKLFLQRSGLL